MGYSEAVAAAGAALKQGEDANWELARLTWENTKVAGDPGSQTDKVTMEEWCIDVRGAAGRKFSEGTGRRYKAIWQRYGRSILSDRPSWTEALTEAAGFPNATDQSVEAKRDLAARLVLDPEVRPAAVEALAADDTGHEEVFDAYIERKDREARKDRLRDPAPAPVVGDVYSELSAEMRRMRNYGELQTRIAVMARAVREWDIGEARAEFDKYDELTPLDTTIHELEEILLTFRRIARREGRSMEVVS